MTVPIGGNIICPPASGSKRDIEDVLWFKLGFHVILAEDPEEPGTVRVYSTASGDELAALNEALREMWPAVIAFRVNDPAKLFVDFTATSQDVERRIRAERTMVAVGVAILWTVVFAVSSIVWIMVSR